MHTIERSSFVRQDTAVAPMVGRFAAVIGTISALGHLVFLVLHGSGHAPVTATLMSVMAIACLVCAWHLWQRSARRVWITSAVMYAGMCLLHLPISADGSGQHAGHHQMHSGSAPAEHGGPIAVLSVLAAVQVLLAVTVLIRSRR